MHDTTALSNIDPQPLIELFARHGYRKTSIQDIANTLGMSRPWAYKKFGSKKACYDWTIHAFLTKIYGRIFDALDRPGALPIPTLNTVFDIAIGEHIELASAKSEHRSQMLDDVLRMSRVSNEDWPLRYQSRVGEFIYKHNYAKSREKALEKAFVMIVASRGFLLEGNTQKAFSSDMHRVINAVMTAGI